MVQLNLRKKEIDRYHDVSYSLRVRAKLLCTHRELHDKENASAKDLVLPENYDRMKNSVKVSRNIVVQETLAITTLK